METRPLVQNVPKRGSTARRHAKLVGKAIVSSLHPGEELRAVVFGQKLVNPAFMFLGELVYALLSKPFYLATSDERLFLFRGPSLGRRVRGLVFADDLHFVELVSHKRYTLQDRISIRRRVDGTTVKLKVKRAYRGDVDLLLAQFAGAASG